MIMRGKDIPFIKKEKPPVAIGNHYVQLCLTFSLCEKFLLLSGFIYSYSNIWLCVVDSAFMSLIVMNGRAAMTHSHILHKSFCMLL